MNIIHTKNISIPEAIPDNTMPAPPHYQQLPKQCAELSNNKPCGSDLWGMKQSGRRTSATLSFGTPGEGTLFLPGLGRELAGQ